MPTKTSKSPVAVRDPLFRRSTIISLAVVWGTVVASLAASSSLLAEPLSPAVTVVAFIVILGATIVAAFRVVHEAEALAGALGEPFGTLILTLSVVIIEVILISSVMLGPSESATIARDSLFAVMMIILNGVMGLALLVGGLRHGPQRYNRQGTSLYIGMISVLTLLALVLPMFNDSASPGSFAPLQAGGLAVLAAAVYGFFLFMQTTKARDLFTQPPLQKPRPVSWTHARTSRNAPRASNAIVVHALLLVLSVTPIVLLSHDLATLLDFGVELLRAPASLSGVVIAAIVFTPEAVTAVRASLNNETQRTINLGLGAFVSTVGLTIPAVLVIGLVTGAPVVLGESPANIVLIATTLLMTLITFTARRATAVHGAVHLLLFGMFTLLIFSF